MLDFFFERGICPFSPYILILILKKMGGGGGHCPLKTRNNCVLACGLMLNCGLFVCPLNSWILRNNWHGFYRSSFTLSYLQWQLGQSRHSKTKFGYGQSYKNRAKLPVKPWKPWTKVLSRIVWCKIPNMQ